MKTISLTASVALALALTACGGNTTTNTTQQPVRLIGGGVTTNTTQQPVSTTETDTESTTSAPVTTIKIAGNIMSIEKDVATTNSATIDSADINQIVVNGQTISFLPTDFAANEINQIDVRTGVGRLGISTENSRFGYFQESIDSLPYLFSQGNISASIPVGNPTSGPVEYTGQAVHYDQGKQDKLKNRTGLALVEAKFVVDFNNKTLTGTIGENLTLLEGNISNNGFSGELNGVSTNGYFYGDNAAELGGTYKNASGTVGGAYGATRGQ